MPPWLAYLGWSLKSLVTDLIYMHHSKWVDGLWDHRPTQQIERLVSYSKWCKDIAHSLNTNGRNILAWLSCPCLLSEYPSTEKNLSIHLSILPSILLVFSFQNIQLSKPMFFWCHSKYARLARKVGPREHTLTLKRQVNKSLEILLDVSILLFYDYWKFSSLLLQYSEGSSPSIF